MACHPSGGFMQSSPWIHCRTAEGYEHRTLILRDDLGEIAGGCVIGRWEWDEGKAFHYVQDGPLLPVEPELREQVASALLGAWGQIARADDACVSHIRLEPRSPADQGLWQAHGFQAPEHEDRFTEPRHSRWIDLRLDEATRLQGMKPKGRYNVRVAQRHGVRVLEDNSDAGWQTFLAIRADTAHRQGLTQRSRRYFDTIRASFGPAARLFLASFEGQALAGALVLTFGERATYFFGGSLALHREVMAPYLLHHEIMNRLAGESMAAYDLWGVAPPGATAHAFDGITGFKHKLGGADLALSPTLDWVIDDEAYRDFGLEARLASQEPEQTITPAVMHADNHTGAQTAGPAPGSTTLSGRDAAGLS